MSIVAKIDGAVLVDHRKFVDKIYECCNDGLSYGFNPVIFEIKTEFMMDSAVKNSMSRGGIPKPIRRRKRTSNVVVDPDDMNDRLETKLKRFIADGHFDRVRPNEQELLSNNRDAREFSKLINPVAESLKTFRSCCDGNYDESAAVLRKLEGMDFLIPPRSRYHLGSISDFLSDLPTETMYDVVVMDPPWTNRCVKRKRGYKLLDNERLLGELTPLGKHLSPGCLVLVWTTNKKKHREFVTDELFKALGIESVTKWYWLKVTCRGVPVHPIASSQKKPYEVLIVGVKSPDGGGGVLTGTPHQVIVSVPSGIHSHKPPLCDIVEPLLRDGHRNRLELFARSLVPGWTSCGDQVLSIQHRSLYVPT